MRVPVACSVLVVVALGACSGRERPRVTPVAEVASSPVEPSQSGADEVEVEPPMDVPEETSTPEGPECRRTTECDASLACRGTSGCGAAWACAQPLECGATRVAYCDCDGATFHAPAGCPGRAYDHVGPCADFGPRLAEGMDMGIPDGDEPLTSQDRVCEDGSECGAGQFCMGVPGCASEWRCARARGCAFGGRGEFCGCDGQTFTARSRCPNRPYLHTGPCREGDEMIAGLTPGGSRGGAGAAGARSSAASSSASPSASASASRPGSASASSAAQASASPSATTTAAGVTTAGAARSARSCTSSRQCPAGQVCQGEPGCGAVEWTCGRPRQTCVRDTQVFCGCDDEDFRASMFCPGRPYAHRGSCEIDRLLDLSGARQR